MKRHWRHVPINGANQNYLWRSTRRENQWAVSPNHIVSKHVKSSLILPQFRDLQRMRRGVCTDCAGTGSGAAASPQCNGPGQVTQAAGAMRFNLTCPRCLGRGRLIRRSSYVIPTGR